MAKEHLNHAALSEAVTNFDYTGTPLPVSYFERKYNLSRVTFWRYRRAGLPAIGVGAKTFVRESDFVAFLQRMNGQTVSSAPAKAGIKEGK